MKIGPYDTTIFHTVKICIKNEFKFSVVLDSNGDDCQMVNMQIGGATTTTRSWDIKVTQYNCGDEDMGGKY